MENDKVLLTRDGDDPILGGTNPAAAGPAASDGDASRPFRSSPIGHQVLTADEFQRRQYPSRQAYALGELQLICGLTAVILNLVGIASTDNFQYIVGHGCWCGLLVSIVQNSLIFSIYVVSSSDTDEPVRHVCNLYNTTAIH